MRLGSCSPSERWGAPPRAAGERGRNTLATGDTRVRVVGLVLALCLLGLGVGRGDAQAYPKNMVTGGTAGTYIKIGQDIAALVLKERFGPVRHAAAVTIVAGAVALRLA